MRVARALALAATAAFAAATATLVAREPAAMDFIAQYAAARLVLDGRGAAILDPASIQAAEHAAAPERVALLPFVHPPAVALLLAPVASAPFGLAFAVMAALGAALILLSVKLLQPTVGGLGLAGVLLAPPAVLAVAQGQTSPLVLLLVAVSLRASAAPSGIALGLTLLRPQTAPLLLLSGLLDPERRPWILVGSAAVVLASAAVVGPDGLVRYAAILADASQWSLSGELGLARDIGWSGLVAPFGLGLVGLIASGVGLIAGAVAVARAEPKARPRVAAVWAIVASPHVLMHDGLLAYPAVLALARRGAPWDVGSIAIWLEHMIAAPVACLWSVVIAVRTTRDPNGE